MRKFAGIFGIVMGVGMLGMWTMFFIGGQVPEVRTAPIALAFHLAAEGVTALLMLAAGIALLARASWARTAYLVGLGFLGYTVIVSPGYFAQLGQLPFVGMFAAFGVLAAVAGVGVARLGTN